MNNRAENPYRPGFNQPPVVFAGRADVLDGATEALEVAAYDGRTPRPIILVGPRGVGKTVTLGEIATLAAERHAWPTIHVEAASGNLIDDLTAQLSEAQLAFEGRTADKERPRSRISGGRVEARLFGFGGAVELERTLPADERDLTRAFANALEAATERGAGLVVTLDELQNATRDELHTLGALLQRTVPLGWPLVVAMAALPGLRGGRGPRQMPTYLERAEWHQLDSLPTQDARRALTEPAARAGRPMSQEAADLLLGLSSGYPYAIQVAGHFAWRASRPGAEITEEHARLAVPRIQADFEQLFKGRWADASPKERRYLEATAAATRRLGRAPDGGDVAAELKQAVTAVSYLRDRLRTKGTIYADAAGGLHFITPGMADWIRGQETTN